MRKTFKIFVPTFIAAIMLTAFTSCGKSFHVPSEKKQVIWDNGKIRITLDSFDNSDKLKPTAMITVDNKTNDDYYCDLTEAYVNNLQVYVPMCLNLEPKSSYSKELAFGYTGQFKDLGIKELGTVDMDFLIRRLASGSDKEDHDIQTGYIQLYTDAETRQPAPIGDVVYDKDGIKIISLYNNYWEKVDGYLPMYIENSRKERVDVDITKARVDGVEKDINSGVFNVDGGRNELNIYTVNKLYEKDEKKPDSIEVQFRIETDPYNSKSKYDDIVTDYINIPVKK